MYYTNWKKVTSHIYYNLFVGTNSLYRAYMCLTLLTSRSHSVNVLVFKTEFILFETLKHTFAFANLIRIFHMRVCINISVQTRYTNCCYKFMYLNISIPAWIQCWLHIILNFVSPGNIRWGAKGVKFYIILGEVIFQLIFAVLFA